MQCTLLLAWKRKEINVKVPQAGRKSDMFCTHEKQMKLCMCKLQNTSLCTIMTKQWNLICASQERHHVYDLHNHDKAMKLDLCISRTSPCVLPAQSWQSNEIRFVHLRNSTVYIILMKHKQRFLEADLETKRILFENVILWQQCCWFRHDTLPST